MKTIDPSFIVGSLKKIAEITGKYLSFPKLKKYIENSALRRETIILMILLPSDEEIRGKSSWNKLARRFFKEYNESIHAVCGYDTGIDGIGNIVAERDFSELSLYTVGRCMRTGILTDCSFDRYSLS